MSRFAESADSLLAAIGAGATMREACTRLDIPYATARTWVANGRRDPEGPYGAWVRRLDATKTPPADAGDDGVGLQDSGPGPVESRLDVLLGERVLAGEAALAAAQARVLARKVDQLGETPGAAAGQALAHCSRRLEELVPLLETPREDDLDRLKAKFRARRSGLRANASEHANGKGSGEVKIERGDGW